MRTVQEGERKRDDRARALNHEQARLIGMAVNNPKDFPDLDKLLGRERVDPKAPRGNVTREQEDVAKLRSAMFGLMNARVAAGAARAQKKVNL